MDEAGAAGPPAAPAVELRQIAHVLFKWRWLIVALTGTAVLTSAFFSFFVLPKVYEAQATLDVSYAAAAQGQGGQGVPQSLQGVIQSVATLPQNTLATYQWQVTNPVVLNGTATALAAQGIRISPGAIGAMVRVAPVAGTNLMTVSVTGTSPQLVAQVANTLCRVYLATIQEQDHTKLTQAVAFLQGEAARVRQRLEQASAALAQAESVGGSAASAQVQAAESELQGLQSQQTQAEIALQAAQAGLQALQQQAASIPPTLTATTLTPGAKQPVHTVEPNPAYTALQQQLAAQRVTVAQDQATVQALQASANSLAAQVAQSAGQAAKGQAMVQALRTEVSNLTSTYQTLTQSLTQAQVADAMSLGGTVVTLAAPATVPTVPIKPNKKLNIALALLLGLVVSAALAFVLDQLDNTVKSPEDVQRLTRLPTLAVIPHSAP